MIITYKYRLKDNNAKRLLAQHAYACNQVWNWCVSQHNDTLNRYRLGEKPRPWLTPFDLNIIFKGFGKEIGVLQETIEAVCAHWTRNRSTRFRSSFGTKRALGWVPFRRRSTQIDGSGVTYRGHTYRFFGSKRRVAPSDVRSGSFVEDALGRWWVCFQVDVEKSQPETGEIGIDLGLKDFASLSTGEKIQGPRSLRAVEAKLIIAQRAKKLRRVRALHAKAANIRRDFHQKLSTRLSREYAFIAVGDVNPKALAKTKLAKSVLDAGWSAFREMLRYKTRTFVKVDERFTTQACSSCGALPPERPRGIAGLGIREWDCSQCGDSHDRDVNAAKNILILGRSAAPLAEESRDNKPDRYDSPIDAESATVTPAIRVLTKKFGGLLGPEYLIGYGTRYFRCGELSLSQLKRGISPDELCMLEIEDPENPGWDD